MSLPEDWITVRVTARYARRDGSVPKGFVRFTSPQVLCADGVIITPACVTASLAGGEIDTRIAATDQPGVSPAGWAWTVEEFIDDLPRRRFAIFAPAGSNIDLANVAPVVPPPLMGTLAVVIGAKRVEVLPTAPDPMDLDVVYITTE